MKFLILNGPNLNQLRYSEPGCAGEMDYEMLVEYVQSCCGRMGIETDFFQSNHEGDLIDEIQSVRGRADGIVLNPAGYAHTSVAILDALKAVALPAVEVHISAVSERESFRQVSYAGMACCRTFAGHGFAGYRMAAEHLLALQRGVIAGASSRVEITVE